MVNAGWAHRDLMAMSEAEFVWHLQQQIAIDEAKAEARRQAARR